MPRIEKYRYGKVIYDDCMDEEVGLPSLSDNSFDLGFTDPPWLIGMDMSEDREHHGRKLKGHSKKHHYNDSYSDEWNFIWFKELKRVCKGVIIIMSRSKLIWWVKNTDPIDIGFGYFTNGRYSSKVSKINCFTPYLFYGDFFKKHKLMTNVIPYVISWGFLNDDDWIHPSPKGLNVAIKILRELNPNSILDPFLGSGTFAQASTILGIKWLGYEIKEIYSKDIEKRLKNTKKEPKQKRLINYI